MAEEKVERFIVCGIKPGELPGVGVCVKCGATVFPTMGTALKAQAEKLALICINCVPKEYEFGGVIHHGNMLSDAAGAFTLAVFEAWRKANGKS